MRIIREAIAIAACAFSIGVVWQSWNRLPAQVPIHFSARGTPDNYGAPSALFMVPIIAIFLYLTLTVASFFPEVFNYPVKVTDQNRKRLQLLAISMLGWIKTEVMCTLAYITWASVRVAMGKAAGLSAAFLPIMLGLLAATIIAGIVQMRRAA